MIECLYHGALWSRTGYAEAARNGVLALHAAGVRLEVDPTGFTKSVISISSGRMSIRRHVMNPSLKLPHELLELITDLRYHQVGRHAPKVIHAPAPVFRDRVESGRSCIGYMAWETERMPESWVQAANLTDEIWVPCSHNVRALRASGVKKPVYIIPHPIDTERFCPSAIRLNGMFTFVSVFQWGARKGWPELIAAYEKAFDAEDPVILRIVTNLRRDDQQKEVKEVLARFDRPGAPRIEVHSEGCMSYGFVPLLYQNADVFVLASRGEGFCLPCAEAMACGVPAIVGNHTAFLDYVDAENGYPVAYRVERADDPFDKDRDALVWCVLDVDDLAEKMRLAYESRGIELGQRGALARQTIINKFNFGLIGRMMMERLGANGGK